MRTCRYQAQRGDVWSRFCAPDLVRFRIPAELVSCRNVLDRVLTTRAATSVSDAPFSSKTLDIQTSQLRNEHSDVIPLRWLVLRVHRSDKLRITPSHCTFSTWLLLRVIIICTLPSPSKSPLCPQTSKNFDTERWKFCWGLRPAVFHTQNNIKVEN